MPISTSTNQEEFWRSLMVSPVTTSINPNMVDPIWEENEKVYRAKISELFKTPTKMKKEETKEHYISSISQHREEIFDLLDPYIHSRFRTGSTFILNKDVSELRTDEDWVCLLNISNKDTLEEIFVDGKKYLSLDIIKCDDKNNTRYSNDDNIYYIFRYGALNLICIFETNQKHYLSWAYSTYLTKQYKIYNKRDRITIFSYNIDVITDINTVDLYNLQSILPNIKLNAKDCKEYLLFIACKIIPQHIIRSYLTGG